MTEESNIRTLHLLGSDACERLANSHVTIVGVGGVGGYAAEMLARAGVGHLTLIDADAVAESNINRQLIATHSTIGQPKTELFRQRFLDINPTVKVNAIQEFLDPENIQRLIDSNTDYVIDAIDTVAPKTALIEHCMRKHIPIISSMGAGGRIDPTAIEYCDLWDTREDGLARAVRQRLKKDGMRRPLKVVASHEKPKGSVIDVETRNKRSSYGTIAAIPSVFGIYLANFVLRKITNQ